MKTGIKTPFNKPEPVGHEDHLILGADPGGTVGLALMDCELNLLKLGLHVGWDVMGVYDVFAEMVEEYEEQGFKIFLAVETTREAVYGLGGIKRGIDVGKTVQQGNDLESLFKRLQYPVTRIQADSRKNPHLNMKTPVFNHAFPDFTRKLTNGQLKSHPTVPHERDAVGIAICGLEKLKNWIIEREYV